MRTVFIYGIPIKTQGPFTCAIKIGPNPVVIEVFLTEDKRFKERFIVGQDAWGVLPVKAMMMRNGRIAKNAAEPGDAHVEMTATKSLNQAITTLIDTGAGPTVMSKETYLRMGYQLEDLQPSLYQLTMADESDMKTLGHAYNVPITIGQVMDLTPNFVICESLGRDDAILGREFIIKYDVALDLPRQDLGNKKSKRNVPD